jgi:hypothetical protein
VCIKKGKGFSLHSKNNDCIESIKVPSGGAAPAFEAAAGSANKSELNEIAVECDNFN